MLIYMSIRSLLLNKITSNSKFEFPCIQITVVSSNTQPQCWNIFDRELCSRSLMFVFSPRIFSKCLKLEFHTEISMYMFHSQKPADSNFPPLCTLEGLSSVLSPKWLWFKFVGNFVGFFSIYETRTVLR